MKNFYKAWALLEEHNALIFSFIGALMFWMFGHRLFDFLDSNVYNYVALYEAVFGISGVLFAFLFAFYTYIISSDSQFIKVARETDHFRKMISYVKRATFIAICLNILTIPTLVLEINPSELYSWEWVYGLIWASATFEFAAAFWRANAIFWIFAKGAE